MARTRSYAKEFEARQRRARALGWTGYREQRRWRARLSDAYVRQLAEEIGGPVEPERSGSLMSIKANQIINPRTEHGAVAYREGDWRVRLLVAAGRIPEREGAT